MPRWCAGLLQVMDPLAARRAHATQLLSGSILWAVFRGAGKSPGGRTAAAAPLAESHSGQFTGHYGEMLQTILGAGLLQQHRMPNPLSARLSSWGSILASIVRRCQQYWAAGLPQQCRRPNPILDSILGSKSRCYRLYWAQDCGSSYVHVPFSLIHIASTHLNRGKEVQSSHRTRKGQKLPARRRGRRSAGCGRATR